MNLGSYNYLGFGGVNSYCTPLVEEAVRDLPLTTGSSDAELGHTQVPPLTPSPLLPHHCSLYSKCGRCGAFEGTVPCPIRTRFIAEQTLTLC